MTYTMPIANSALINLISPEAQDFLNRITLKNGKLRATKPKNDGDACFVWRMVAFYASPNPKHKCMPVCADFDMVWEREDELEKAYRTLGWNDPSVTELFRQRFDWRAKRTKELNLIVDEILKVIPFSRRSGAAAFGRALGMI